MRWPSCSRRRTVHTAGARPCLSTSTSCSLAGPLTTAGKADPLRFCLYLPGLWLRAAALLTSTTLVGEIDNET